MDDPGEKAAIKSRVTSLAGSAGMRSPKNVAVVRQPPGSSLAGFQVTLFSRICVTPEVPQRNNLLFLFLRGSLGVGNVSTMLEAGMNPRSVCEALTTSRSKRASRSCNGKAKTWCRTKTLPAAIRRLIRKLRRPQRPRPRGRGVPEMHEFLGCASLISCDIANAGVCSSHFPCRYSVEPSSRAC